MKKIDFILIFALFLLFLGVVFVRHREVFTSQFNPSVVQKYLRSQDIEDTENVIKDRIFVSDSVIYSAAGYLYAKGADPTSYNFQHPPLVKYLFGFSSLFFGNVFLVQIIFGVSLVFLTYFIGIRLLDNKIAAFLAAAFLIFDPAFLEQISSTLLDLGQAVFAIFYFVFVVLFPESFVLQGISLGLFAASKFWSTAIIFVALLLGYRFFVLKKKVDYKKLFYSFLIAFLIFSLTYLKTFIDASRLFNIFYFEGRVLKFMLQHNSATFIGGSILLYITGYFVKWWGTGGISKATTFSILWPTSFVVAFFKTLFSKKKAKEYLISALPVVYLTLTLTQVPFTRYFILVLPFFYLSLSQTLVKVLQKHVFH